MRSKADLMTFRYFGYDREGGGERGETNRKAYRYMVMVTKDTFSQS